MCIRDRDLFDRVQQRFEQNRIAHGRPAKEDVAIALENLGVPQDEMRRRVDDSMKMAGIYEYLSLIHI